MRVYLQTLGCRLNEAESAAWARALRKRGGAVVASPGQADVVVLNTCAVTMEAARKSRKLTGRLHRSNPAAKLVLTGCLAALEPDNVAALAGVDLVLGNAAKDDLVELLSERLNLPAPGDPVSASDHELALAQSRTRAFVKVQDGCRNRCAFCIVTVARGEERSRSIDEVVDEVNELHAAGFGEAVLTGVHLGGYGADLGTNLHALVDQLLRRTAIPRLRLSSLEPWEIAPDFWQLWGNDRLCPHLHLPLQSGSDRLLRRMARRSDVTSYHDLVRGARAAIPHLTVTTDLIVGFPGETEADFGETLALAEQIGFAHIHVFPYSPRAGTAAARMDEQVDPEAKRQRGSQLRELAQRSRAEVLARYVGSERAVLWEGQGQRVGSRRRWSGLTDNYLRVEALARPELNLEGSITPARLLAVEREELLRGEVLLS